MQLNEAKRLREERAVVVRAMHDVTTQAAKENRSLSGEEKEKFDKMESDERSLKDRIETAERIERADGLFSSLEKPIVNNAAPVATTQRNQSEYLDAFRAWGLAKSKRNQDRYVRAAERCGIDWKDHEFAVSYRGTGNQTEASGAAGDYLVQDTMASSIERALKQYSSIRNIATVVRTTGSGDMNFPTNDDTSNKAIILSEASEVIVKDTAFGNKNVPVFKFSAGIIKVSYELLSDANFNLAAYVGESLGERIARGTNDFYTTGGGTTEPWGYLEDSVQAGVCGVALEYEDLIQLYHGVDPSYRSNGTWVMSDNALAGVKRIVSSGDDRPLWNVNLAIGAPDTIFGKPVVINQSAPDLANDEKVMAFGDFSKFVVRDAGLADNGPGVLFRRLDERYAEFGLVGFMGLSRSGSRLIDGGTHPIKHLLALTGS